MQQIGDGVFRCAEFVEVVHLNKEAYPNGIRKYKVSRGETAEEIKEEPIMVEVEQTKVENND